MRLVSFLCVLASFAMLRPASGQAVPGDMAVSYLVQTVTLRGATIRIEPKHRPQRVSPAAALTAVTRIEVPAGASVTLTDGHVDELAYAIADTAELARVRAVQVDYDVTIAQRCFYRQLLHRVRDLLPPDIPLSMTALASWCMDDDWISDLPVDEAVPMIRTGREWQLAATRARAEGRDHAGPCRNALGVPASR